MNFNTVIVHIVKKKLKQSLAEFLGQVANYYDIKDNSGSWLAVDNLVTKAHIHWLLLTPATKAYPIR